MAKVRRSGRSRRRQKESSSGTRAVKKQHRKMFKKQGTSSTNSFVIVLDDQLKKEEQIVLKLNSAGIGCEADRFSYSIGRNTRLLNLMLDFTTRVGVAFNSVRFYYQNEPIFPAFPAEKMEMKDGDTINVIRDESSRPSGATQSTLITLPLVVDGEKPIVLNLQGFKEDSSYCYLIGQNTQFINLVLDYAERICELYEHTNLMTYDGRRLRLDQTAEDSGLEGGETLYVQPTQCG